ncbi:hypothetical protein KIPB_010604, partial [Kipferlia bialata]
VIIEKAKTNKMLEPAAVDVVKYPAMRDGNWVLHRFKAEVFDFDFGMEHRDHKLLRTRSSFNGYPYNEAGARIDPDTCIGCGSCMEECSFKAIEEDGAVMRVIPSKCDDCGSCRLVCPVDAIAESLPF